MHAPHSVRAPTPPQILTLSAALKLLRVDAFIQPMGDEFQSEYTPNYARRLPFISGFDGSAGTGVFFAQPGASRKHTLFTDGRYLLQAAKQVGGIMAIVDSGEQSLTQWLVAQKAALRIGFDPWLTTQSELQHWQEACKGQKITFVPLNKNPIDALWNARPAFPAGAIMLHPLRYAGKSYREKRAPLLEFLKKSGAQAFLLTQPDAINWLLNIRGSDVEFNPLVVGYFLLRSNGSGTLYSFKRKENAKVSTYLASADIEYVDIQKLWQGKHRLTKPKAKLLLDTSAAPYALQALAEQQAFTIAPIEDPVLLPKALKNAVEVNGIRAAHQRDGHTLSCFLHDLEKQCAAKKFPTECEAIARLESFRKAAKHYRGASFATIAGAGEHGAIIHYRATAETNRKLAGGELFLLDSGGQYPDGTTDVTRTIAIGKPTKDMCEHFTRVLKGHIAIARATFPEGTTGSQLDVLARQFLWEAGLDYEHGTGHGVGAYLCVHEGPQRISKRPGKAALQPGMIVSNEPGYYREGAYGIRIESLVLVTEIGRTEKNRALLGFETLTMAPIDRVLIAGNMLTADEKKWLNSYHRRVFEVVSKQGISAEMRRWLQQATAAL